MTDDKDKRIAELERQLVDAKNWRDRGIEVFLSPCESHSGAAIEPFGEWMEKYGGRCIPCLVNRITDLTRQRGELAAVVEYARRALKNIDWMSRGAQDTEQLSNIARYAPGAIDALADPAAILAEHDAKVRAAVLARCVGKINSTATKLLRRGHDDWASGVAKIAEAIVAREKST